MNKLIFQIKVHSIEDDEEFKKAVDSFDEIFQSESRTDIQRASRNSTKKISKKGGKASESHVRKETDEGAVTTQNGKSKLQNYILVFALSYPRRIMTMRRMFI